MNIAIVGGGASAMILASMLKDKNVTIFEKNQKLGKKLLLTGNGKCNFTSGDFSNIDEIYNNDFAKNIFKKYDNEKCLGFYKSIGILPKVEIHKGIKYYYPNSNKSTSVYYNLLDKIIDNGVDIKYNSEVVDINIENNKFIIRLSDNKTFIFDRVVIATGGISYKNTGSTGDGYRFAEKFGHKIVKIVPGLCPLKSSDKDLKGLKSVRIDAKLTYKEHVEIGELQFTDYGISGIPVYNLSRYVCRDLDAGNETIFVSFFDKSVDDIIKMLSERKDKLSYKKCRDFLCGILPDELAKVILDRAKIDVEKSSKNLTNNDIISLSKELVNFTVNISGFSDYDMAQITIGGVDIDLINPDTMESKLVKNLYFMGEVLDIDGKCGGYNLQMAFSTANAIAESIV